MKTSVTRIAQSLSMVMAVTLVAGCGTVSREQHTVLEERARDFKVLTTDDATNTPVGARDIASALVQSAYASSTIRRQWSFYDNGMLYTRGLDVVVDNSMNITAFYRDDYGTIKKYKAGTFKVTTSTEGKFTKVHVVCPATIEDYDSFKTGIMDSKLMPVNQVAADISKICDGMNIAIQRQKPVKSELNTRFPSDSVFANFSRELPGWRSTDDVKTYDIEKAHLFTLKQGSSVMSVAIAVYPYRNGSKVIYGFGYPYVIHGDGTSSFSAQEVSALEKRLGAIANE